MKMPFYLRAAAFFGAVASFALSIGAADAPVAAESPPTVNDAKSALEKIANRSPAEIAAETEALKARLRQRKAEETSASTAQTTRSLLKQQFQREFAAATTEQAREQLLVEYLVKARTIAARDELGRQEANKSATAK